MNTLKTRKGNKNKNNNNCNSPPFVLRTRETVSAAPKAASRSAWMRLCSSRISAWSVLDTHTLFPFTDSHTQWGRERQAKQLLASGQARASLAAPTAPADLGCMPEALAHTRRSICTSSRQEEPADWHWAADGHQPQFLRDTQAEQVDSEAQAAPDSSPPSALVALKRTRKCG